MLQVVQDIRSGETAVSTLPAPIATKGTVVVANVASLVSAGTERYVVDLARKSLLQKARARPDHVKRVLQKLRQEGARSTLTAVRAKLAEPMELGYSSAGVVIECGEGVQQFKPGDRVAVRGPHAQVAVVGENLCARIPDSVSFEDAAYASVGAIALQSVRLAKVNLGERVLVIGLGLVGQMCVALLKAQGCYVFGTDLDPEKLEMAKTFGADEVALGAPLDAVKAFSESFGVDATLITAATPSNSPIEFAAAACRSKGRIVLVGVVGLDLPREPFFEKELEFTVSFSLGPGRADRDWEEKGIDYPIGYVRWTGQRNMQAVLDAMATGKLPVGKLTTHRFAIDKAPAAYDMVLKNSEPFFGIVMQYPTQTDPLPARLDLKANSKAPGSVGTSLIGVGNFTRVVMLPLMNKIGGISWRGICSAKGMNAVYSGQQSGFAFATTKFEEVLADEQTDAVLVMTRHDLHAEQIIAALKAGKHVFVEKPLCITLEQLQAIDACVKSLGDNCPILMVGFNRRFAPAAQRLRAHFAGVAPLTCSFRFNTPELSANTWVQDEETGGGRVVGEACHAIDVLVSIVGSPPVKVYAESVASVGGLEVTDDRLFITLRHQNGSISSVAYHAGADRAGPNERMEVFGGGRSGTVDGWDAIELWKGGVRQKARGGKDWGHATELEAFFHACRNGGKWPIPWHELYGTTWATLMAVRSLREGVPFGIGG